MKEKLYTNITADMIDSPTAIVLEGALLETIKEKYPNFGQAFKASRKYNRLYVQLWSDKNAEKDLWAIVKVKEDKKKYILKEMMRGNFLDVITHAIKTMKARGK